MDSEGRTVFFFWSVFHGFYVRVFAFGNLDDASNSTQVIGCVTTYTVVLYCYVTRGTFPGVKNTQSGMTWIDTCDTLVIIHH